MNYSNLFKNLINEMKGYCQYKNLSAPFKAFAIVATIPFWFMYGFFIGLTYIYIFIYNCIASFVDYLEKWVKETKKDVNPWTTEAVIYLITMPFIFILRIILSLFSVTFFLYWFFTMCFGYIASLGGIRWQPFISTATFEEDKHVIATTNITAGNTIALIGFILYCIFIVLSLFDNTYTMIMIANIFDSIYTLFMIIAIPITFKKEYKENTVLQIENMTTEQTVRTEEVEEEFPEF